MLSITQAVMGRKRPRNLITVVCGGFASGQFSGSVWLSEPEQPAYFR
ncbi:hypothetical protein DAQ1742_02922 [Dickeya aquatica]|uniref:Uncharacterized protein n=1 Tax=Dickeya aquatica TaxID=1401087 RepID=A0A375ACX4_9GAMM|nr:hypothetical protein DAQ1742_02922 [Dickeya aquatica]